MPEEAYSTPDTASSSGLPSLPSGGGDSAVQALTGRLADNQRGKIEATDKIYSEVESAQSRLLPRIEQLSKNVGVEAGNLKPWNADEESAKRRTDPISAFGSIGSVFGILASAFTHAPMENALNASAAAMNAIKANDDKGYDRAEKAWMNNYKMALDRHRIQHDAYQDAVSLLNTNMTAANTKLQITAARFGDKQVLTMLEAGMSKEVQDILASRQKMALELEQQMPKIVEENAKISRLFSFGYDPTNPQSPQSQEAYEKFRQEQIDIKQAERAYTPEQQAYTQYIREHPEATAEQRSDYIQALRTRKKDLTPEQEATTAFIEQNPNASAEDIKAFVVDLRAKSRPGAAPKFNTDQEIINALKEQHERDGKPPPTATEIAEAVAKKRGAAGAGGNTSLTADRQRAADVAAYRESLKAEKNEDGTPKYTPDQIAEMAAERDKKLKTIAAAPTGNKLDQLKSLRDRAGYMTDTIDKVEALLAKHKALTGIGGTVTRPLEVVSNWFGSNETDRAQFKRYISELHEWGTRVLNESSGRPLSAEMSKLTNIIPGLAAGDTTANTVRAYRELKPLLGAIQGQLDKRIDGTWTPGSAPRLGPTAPPSWSNAPVVE